MFNRNLRLRQISTSIINVSNNQSNEFNEMKTRNQIIQYELKQKWFDEYKKETSLIQQVIMHAIFSNHPFVEYDVTSSN